EGERDGSAHARRSLRLQQVVLRGGTLRADREPGRPDAVAVHVDRVRALRVEVRLELAGVARVDRTRLAPEARLAVVDLYRHALRGARLVGDDQRDRAGAEALGGDR